MIEPTIGRIVYFYETPPAEGAKIDGPYAAIITQVWNDRMVNLTVFYPSGTTLGRSSIVLRQPGDLPAGEYSWCEWMPYQIKKPTGSESGEKAAGVQRISPEGLALAKAVIFGVAIEALKMGRRVCRKGWNGKGMWLMLIPATNWSTDLGPSHHSVPCARRLPWIAMKTVDDGLVPWLASQTDMLAEDWMVVEE